MQLAEANEARSQVEERGAKLKQVLLKNKKELAEARKQIEEVKQTEQQLREQINVFKQLLDGKEVRCYASVRLYSFSMSLSIYLPKQVLWVHCVRYLHKYVRISLSYSLFNRWNCRATRK